VEAMRNDEALVARFWFKTILFAGLDPISPSPTRSSLKKSRYAGPT
jgi:hypothetical protein